MKFLFGAETWIFKLKDLRKIDAPKMWWWRHILEILGIAFHTNISMIKTSENRKRTFVDGYIANFEILRICLQETSFDGSSSHLGEGWRHMISGVTSSPLESPDKNTSRNATNRVKRGRIAEPFIRDRKKDFIDNIVRWIHYQVIVLHFFVLRHKFNFVQGIYFFIEIIQFVESSLFFFKLYLIFVSFFIFSVSVFNPNFISYYFRRY